MPRDRRLADLRVLAMDMDSTLITIECIDEIADHAGIKDAVAAITASAMRGEIDFRASLRAAWRLLEGLPVDALEAVYRERLRLTPGAETLLAAARGVGAKTLLVSGGFTFFTDRLRERLGLDATASNVLEIANGGKLTGRVARRHRRRDTQGGGAAARCARATPPTAAWSSRSATARTTCRCCAPPTSRSPTARSRSCAREATHAIDYGGLDAVLNLFG